MYDYNESLANRAKARATGADVHAVGEITATYYWACYNSQKSPKRHAWNCKRIEEILQIFVGTKLSLVEAKAEQDRQVGLRSKPGLIDYARKQLKAGKKLDPDEFNTPGWKESWALALEEVKQEQNDRAP
jgi:hypothetical protein